VKYKGIQIGYYIENKSCNKMIFVYVLKQCGIVNVE